MTAKEHLDRLTWTLDDMGGICPKIALESLSALRATIDSLVKDRSAMIAEAMNAGLVVSCGIDGHRITHQPELALQIALTDADSERQLVRELRQRIAGLEEKSKSGSPATPERSEGDPCKSGEKPPCA